MGLRATHVLLGLVGSLCLACRPVEVNEPRAGGVAPSIQVRATWESGDGSRLLVGGVFCQLFRPEASEPARWGVTNGVEPLVFRDVEPGPYRVVVLGRDGLELAREVELPPRRRLTVRVDVQAALSQGEATTEAEASARRAVYVRAAVDEAHPESEAVSLLEPGRMQLSTELHAVDP